MSVSSGILVVGIGNEFRQDDGAGPFFVQHYREALEETGAALAVTEGEAFGLIELWKGYRSVFLVDAVHGVAGAPGSVCRFDALNQNIPEEWFLFSTHRFGLTKTIALARAIGNIPERLLVYGITGKKFDFGRGLSHEVYSALGQILDGIRRDVRGAGQTPPRKGGST